MKRSGLGKLIFGVLLMVVVLGIANAGMADDVSTFDALKTALTSPSSSELTIDIQDNITLEDEIKVSSSVTKLTIYLNGNTIDGDENYPFLHFKEPCNLTLKNTRDDYAVSHYLDSNGNLDIDPSNMGVIQKCFTNNEGAVINFEDNDNVKITLQDIAFKHNVSDYGTGGGVVFVNGSNCTLTAIGCVFSENANNWFNGGVVYLNNSSTCKITCCEFSDNYGEESGGVLYAYQDNKITISHCVFDDNEAGYECGGAIYVCDGTILQVDHTIFSSNVASSQGGAICQEDSILPDKIETGILKIENCKFDSNTADDSGGAIQTKDLKETAINNSEFTANESEDGGAIYISAKTSLFNNCEFVNNNADSNGGAIHLLTTDLAIENCKFKNNSAGEAGGGVYVYETAALSLDGTSSFSVNTADIGHDIAICKDEYEALINITGDLGSKVFDVAKYDLNDFVHRPGVITSGLSSYGTVNNFKSSEGYTVIINNNNEAELVNAHTVTFNNNDGTGSMENQVFVVGATQQLTANAFTREHYTFTGWNTAANGSGTAYTDKQSISLSANLTLYAQWQVNAYPIKFVNEDGAVLQSSPVNYGETPTYTGETPTKAADAQYTYTFAGWSPEIAAVTNEATYTATFTQTINSYPITWLNDDDTVIDTTTVEYGIVPAHDAPTKDADADFIYTFSNWTPDLVSVAGPATYKAQFTATPKTEYTIIWLNGDGTELDRAAYKEGAEEPTTDKVPTKAADADSTYTFSGWDDGTVEGNVKTYTPQFTAALPSEYTIVLTNDGNGSASADPTSGAEGTEVTLTATPKTGYQFKEWQVVSGGVTITENKFSIGKENVEIKAIFEQSTAGKLYYTVSGEGQDHLIGSGMDAAFVVKRSIADETTFSRFTGIQVDGTDTGTGDYEKWEGSVVINLKTAYLDTLSVGSHILTVLFTDGSVDISFTVSEVVEPVIIPPTGFEDVAVPSKTFTFKKVWEGGSEKSIKFTLYKQDGTVYHHGFDKKVISKTEWQYNAWFSEAAACYVMEKPAQGYQTRYENVGIYTGITDRCCDGGTIVNYKVPRTGDNANPMLWLGCALASLTLLCVAVSAGKRRKAN